MADASYPSDLSYHEEHDWARIEGDVATFGITWYAQDQLGEVVFFDPPAVGKTVTKGEPYAEVESVKAVSDVIAPLSGRDRRGQRGPGVGARGDQRGPLPGRLDGQGPALGPVRARLAAGRRRLRGVAGVGVALHLRHRRRPAGDARRGRRRLDRGAVRRRARGRPARAPDRPAAGPAGAGGVRLPARPRRAERLRRGRDHVPRRRDVRPLRAVADRLAARAVGVPDAVHAVPAGGLAGDAPGHVRVPDGDVGADRPAGLERHALRGAVGRRVGRLARPPAQPPQPLPRLARACIRTRAARSRRRARGGGRRSRSSRSRAA